MLSTPSIKMDASSPQADHIPGDVYIDTNDWTRFALRAAISSALHPLDYARTLIQLGYEPIPPTPARSLFNKPVLSLPDIFQYAGYIRSTDGILGCYRGLIPKLCGNILSILGSEKILEYLGLESYEEQEKNDAEVNPYELFKTNLKRDMIVSASGLVISYPFQVISVRMMAQFIGRETFYKSIIGSIIEIYKYEGLYGFFNGFIPKLIYELALVLLTSSTVFVANKYIIKDKVSRQMNASLIQISFTILLYPLKVVSTCMSITGSRLLAAKQPFLPAYVNWTDCLRDLQARGEDRRGGCVFLRTVPVKHFISNSSASQSFKKSK